MSFLKKLFGGGSEAKPAAPAGPVKELEHKGFLIKATPYKEGSEFQTCGVVSKEIDGELKEHRFVRADRFGDINTAADISIVKGRQLVDEQGDRIFG
ncbi:HlyU family transcriptional regulator [Tianweitania populi]|uniref:Transcriptional activator HlyU n=1 Tax=Tianweitania populi TaxID=1607949 RepID=A0A8J3DQ86_9HYPH|nr:MULTISPECIES: HlyU family transcriptional regulator [Tianweitania]GHD11286.1 hypothetical protein GCM10016234_14260 [Tianweitania populi]